MISEKAWESLTRHISRGHSRRDAALLAGIPLQAMQKLHEDARLGDAVAQARVTQLEEWEAKSVDKFLGHVETQAEEGSLKAAQFMLKTLRPDRFGGHNPKLEIHQAPPQPQVAQTGDAKERIYGYAVRLLKEHPEYLQRLMDDLGIKALPAVMEAEVADE